MSAGAATTTRVGVGDGGAGMVVGCCEEVPDVAGDVTFEAANRFQLRLSLGLSALEVGAGGGVGLLGRAR